MWDPNSDENSDWAPEVAAPQAGGRTRRAPPAQRAERVSDSVLRNRVTQRQYLQRKKVISYPRKMMARLASKQPRVSAVLKISQGRSRALRSALGML